MHNIAVMFVLLFVCVLICAVFCGVGFFIGMKVNVYRPKKPPDEDEQTKVKQKQAKRALDNLMSYTGDEQE